MQDADYISIAEAIKGMPQHELVLDFLSRKPCQRPRELPFPPSQLAGAIERVRQAGGGTAEKRVLDSYAADENVMRLLGEYREQLTYLESVNSRTLRTLVWCRDVLRDLQHQTEGVRSMWLQLERFAYDHWGFDVLSSERGWSDRVCKSYKLLPTCWREL